MPWLGALIAGALLNIAGSLVARVLTALGLGVVSYVGINTTLTWLKTNFLSSVMSLDPTAIAVMSLLGVGKMVSMVFSALVVRATLQGMQSDTVKAWAKK
nr:DUF2523 domain-containing protein [uncultured Rhodoferax sp.]